MQGPNCFWHAAAAMHLTLALACQSHRPNADDEQPDWKPALALAAASTTHQPLPATRFCLDARGGAAAATAAAAGRFLVGSLDGELAAVDASCFSLEHKVGR